MKGRALAASTAAFLIVLFPVIIAGQTKKPPEAPAPEESSLTIHLTAPLGAQGTIDKTIAIRALGSPPSDPVSLRNDDGSLVAVATVSSQDCPESAPIFDSGLRPA